VIGPFTGDYAFLSNFYPAPFAPGQVLFPTVEHYYQAAKASSADGFRYVLDAPTPGEAKRRGRAVPLVPFFERDKKAVMLRGVLAKFTQHPELRGKLLGTGSEHLEEVNTWGDVYWGTAGGYGENWLGRILMMTREILA
jgi:hypothetical protein